MIASTIIEKIRTAAATAADKHAEAARVEAARVEAEGTILSAALEAVAPALSILVGTLRSSYRTTGVGTDRQREHIELHTERGRHLAGDSAPSEDAPRDNRGSLEGHGLYILEDGRLVERTWTGSWSRWQGEGESWVSTLREVTTDEACERAEEGLETLVQRILEMAEKAAKIERSEPAELARLQQIVGLLQGTEGGS
jgi:hypothetical protein